MKLLRLALVGTLLFCRLYPCHAQESCNVAWSTNVETISPYEARLIITAQILPDWHLYSQYLMDGGPQPTRFDFLSNSAYQLSGFNEKGKPHTYYDNLFEMDVTWYSDRVDFIANIKLVGPSTRLRGTVAYMTCNAETCVPEKKDLEIPIDLTKSTR